MDIKFIEGADNQNDALLSYSIDENKIKIIHSNFNDGHYGYVFELKGTEEELKVIKEFCDKIEEAK